MGVSIFASFVSQKLPTSASEGFADLIIQNISFFEQRMAFMCELKPQVSLLFLLLSSFSLFSPSLLLSFFSLSLFLFLSFFSNHSTLLGHVNILMLANRNLFLRIVRMSCEEYPTISCTISFYSPFLVLHLLYFFLSILLFFYFIDWLRYLTRSSGTYSMLPKKATQTLRMYLYKMGSSEIWSPCSFALAFWYVLKKKKR